MNPFIILLISITGVLGKSIFFNPPQEIPGTSISRSGSLSKPAVSIRAAGSWEAFRPHGLGNNCRSLGLWKGSLVAAGDFKSADGMKASHAARWDGTRWQPLGSLDPVDVWSANILPVGDSLFLQLSSTGGIGSDHLLAKWGGQDWIDIQEGLPAAWQYRLVEAGGGVYATGMGLFKWEGTWKPLGGALTGEILDVETVGGDLYASGQFILPGSADTVGMAKWSGAAWTPMAAPPNVDGGRTWGLIQMGGVLFAILNIVPHENLLARWDGVSWTTISGADLPLEFVGGLQESGGVLYLGGSVKDGTGFRIFRYDGSGFVPDREFHPRDGYGFLRGINTFRLAGDALYVGGTFSGFGNVRADGVARWAGGAWHAYSTYPAPAGPSGTPWNFLSVGSTLVLGGPFTFAGTRTVNGIATWDGADWGGFGEGLVPLGTPKAETWPVQAMASLDRKVIVGGRFDTLGCLDCRGLARWDGSNWLPLGLGVEGTVSAMTDYLDDMYIGGDITAIRGVTSSTQKPWVVLWDGSNLFPIGDGLPGPVSRLVKYKDKLYAHARGQGADQGKFGIYQRGGSWGPVEFSGLKILSLSTAVEFGGDLYLAGVFETDSRERRFFIRWNGQAWEAMKGVTIVTALATDGINLYASGRDNVSDAGFDGIAAWNGSVWTPLASMLSENIVSLHAHGGFLYAGLKNEETFGNEWSFKLARLGLSPQTGIQAARGAPRQPRLGVGFSWDGIGSGEFLDLQGRKRTVRTGRNQAAGFYIAK